MKNSFDKLFLVVLLLAVTFSPARSMAAASPAASLTEQQAQTEPAAVLCLPGIYTYLPGDCLPSGPSAYLSRMAEKGITLPLPPLAYQRIDPALGSVSVRYAEVTNLPAPIFSSIEEAVSGSKKAAAERLDGDFVFISYTNEQESNGRKLYEVRPGAWMTGNYLSRLGAIPQPHGITFNSTPSTAFGWVLTYFSPTPQVETKRTPGYSTPDYTGRLLNLYDIVQVFATEQVNDEPWYLIGPDEWLPGKFVARVLPDPTPPDGVTGDRWIEVNLLDQTLAVYEQRQLVYATLIASGAKPFWTRPGVFQIYEKHEMAPMTGAFEADKSDAYYLEDVPWTMYYDKARALHGAYWRAKMGFEQSHGCVNLAVGDAHWLFDWAKLGDWVYVWDPSGETPTDESLYSSGGY
jgi:hypothetical protein